MDKPALPDSISEKQRLSTMEEKAMFPETTTAWRRLKLNLAEALVHSAVKDRPGLCRARALRITLAIDEIRNVYFPRAAREQTE